MNKGDEMSEKLPSCPEPLPKELTPFEKNLSVWAAEASADAIRRTFAAGLSITVLRGNRIVRVAPDGTETFLEYLPE